MPSRHDRFLIPALVGFAPPILVLMTWAPNGLSILQRIIRLDAVPVFAIEVFAFVVASREGLFGWLARIRPPPLALIALGIWLAVTLATSLFIAPDQISAIRWSVHWIVHLAFGFSIAFLCSDEVRVRDFVHFYLVGFVLFAVLLAAFVACSWHSAIDWRRDLPAATNIRHIAIYAGGMTAMSIGMISSGQRRSERSTGIVLATLGFFILLWTGSRGAILSVCGALAIGAVLVPALRQPKIWAQTALSLGIATVAASLTPVPSDGTMGVARLVGATMRDDFSSGRLQLWADVLRAITRRPVFGYGPGQLAQLVQLGDVGQAHNLVLEILLSWGTVGFACVALAGFFYVRSGIGAARRDQVVLVPPLMTITTFLLLSMVDGALFHVLPVASFAACAGMIGSRCRGCAPNEDSRHRRAPTA